MTLEHFISDLLYRYDCVIIPNFGGFLTKEISAKVNHYTHTFYAPSKQLSFNSNLHHNDGLLANYIATCESISYNESLNFVEKQVANWRQTLSMDSLELELLGTFTLKNNLLVFEPNNSVNYLTDAFGLATINSPAIKRIIYKEKAAILLPKEPAETTPIKKTPAFIRYAAAAVILFSVGVVGYKEYQKDSYNKLVLENQQKQSEVENKIQKATFEIENPLPTITLKVEKKTHNFHIVAGAFREPANAEKKLNQLLKKGYNASILGINKWNLTQVAFASFDSKIDALTMLKKIQKTESEDAWLLVKEY